MDASTKRDEAACNLANRRIIAGIVRVRTLLLLDLLVDSMIYSRPIARICSARPRKFIRLVLDAANWKNEI